MWFNDAFLLSLYKRAGLNNTLWLTQKQTSICCQYMTEKTVIIEDQFGQYRHTNYTYNWDGREVFLSYSKKNGCGTITFHPNDNEKRQLFEEYCEEKRKEILNDSARRIDRAKRFVEGKSGLFEKYTPDEYIQRLKKYKHRAVNDFHCHLYAYRNSTGEEKVRESLKLFEEYQKYISLKECIKIVKKHMVHS